MRIRTIKHFTLTKATDGYNQAPDGNSSCLFHIASRNRSSFSELGVTADQFVLLATLDREHAITQRELAKRMPSDPSTVRAMLVLLEKQGLVVRVPHPSDARAKSVSLTAQGQKKFDQLWAASESIRQSMSSALNEKEYRILVKLLNQVTEALQNPKTEPVLEHSV